MSAKIISLAAERDKRRERAHQFPEDSYEAWMRILFWWLRV